MSLKFLHVVIKRQFFYIYLVYYRHYTPVAVVARAGNIV